MRKKHEEAVTASQDAAVANDQVSSPSFTIPELAKRWRVNRHTISAAIHSGKLQAFKPNGRVYRIRLDEVLRFEHQPMAVAS